MKKGKITITKHGGVKIKPEGSKKELSVPKEFDFTAYIPEMGKNRFECQFEVNDKNAIIKVMIEGKSVPINEGIKKKKAEEKEQAVQKAANEARQKQAEKAKERAQKDGTWWDDSFKADESCLPVDTQALLLDSDNFYLKLNKVPRYIEDKFYFFKNDYHLKKQTGHRFQIKPNFGHFDFARHCARHQTMAKALCNGAQNLVCQTLHIDWRLILGLGHDSVYETSMTLHHIYGIPYLPASSIKGVVRNWVIQTQYFSKLSTEKQLSSKAGEEAEKLALQNQQFCDVFGCGEESFYKEACQGRIVFFDAFPSAKPQIEVDIMNPHYPDYYSESAEQARTAPTDYQSPVPIPFLTVGRQTTDQKPLGFQIMIGVQAPQHVSLLKVAENWLQQALTQRGIGAKTAVGYGYLNL